MPDHSNIAKDVLDKIFEATAPQLPSDPGDLPPPIAPESSLNPDLFEFQPSQDYQPIAGDISIPIWDDAPPQLPDPPSFDDYSGNHIL